MAWKYIIFDVKMPERNGESGLQFEVPIIFPESLVHAFMGAVTVEALKSNFPGADITTVRAGSIGRLDVDGVGGKSDTLGLSSASTDRKMITLYPYTRGMVDSFMPDIPGLDL